MQSVLEFAPVAVFGVVYYLHGIYVATAALMIAMLVLLVVDLAWLKRIPTMHALSAGLVFAFGAATLILHNQRFIQWKPTVLFWLISLAFLGSSAVCVCGGRPGCELESRSTAPGGRMSGKETHTKRHATPD